MTTRREMWKKQVLSALRSGSFKQGKGRLRTGSDDNCELCVWGLIQKVSGLGTIDLVSDTWSYDGSRATSVPPDSVLNELGIPRSTANGWMTANDATTDFLQLAERIDKEWVDV